MLCSCTRTAHLGDNDLYWRRNRTLLGLDVGSSAVKAVEITLHGPEPVITGFAHMEIPAGSTAADVLPELMKQGRFKARRAAAALAGPSTVVRYVPMQLMSDEELRAAIRFESDKYLPFDVDECRLDCQALDALEPEAKTRTVLLAAARNSLVDERVAQVRSLGLAPECIDVDLFALANAWELCAPPEADGTPRGAVALVDVGAVRTSIHVLANGRTRFSREIPIGGTDMTAAVARRMSLDPVQAEEAKRSGEADEQVAAAAAPVLEDLANELALSLEYVEHHEGVVVDEVLLSGGGALCAGTREQLELAVQRPVRWWSPLEGLRVDESRVDVEQLGRWTPTLAVAVGLASRVRAA